MDWLTLFYGILLTIAVEILFVFLAPESWKEPIAGLVRRTRKWWQNPPLKVSASKQLEVQDPAPPGSVRMRVGEALREAGLWRQDATPVSFEFKVATSTTEFDVRVAEMHDPTMEGNEPPTLLLTLASNSTYRDLEQTLSDLPAAETKVRQALQRGPRFVESRFQIRIGLVGSFPMAGFFRELEPIVLNCRTRDGSIEFDYSPGALVVRAELDASTRRWLKRAIVEL